MTADLGFIAHAAQCNSRKLAPQRVGHAPAERSLADTGRAHEAEDRPFQSILQLDDGQKLQQSVLHLGQTVVLLIENARGRGEINFVFRRFRPGQIDDPIKIIA